MIKAAQSMLETRKPFMEISLGHSPAEEVQSGHNLNKQQRVHLNLF